MAALGLFLPLRQPVLLVGPRSPVQLPTCGQAQGALSARQVPRAALSLHLWPRDTSHVVPLLSSRGCPTPSSKPWLGGLAPCSLLPLEPRPPGLCRPPGSLRAPVGALATHTARSRAQPSCPRWTRAWRTAGARLSSWSPPAPSLVATQDSAGGPLGLVSSRQTPLQLCFQAEPSGGGLHWDFAN